MGESLNHFKKREEVKILKLYILVNHQIHLKYFKINREKGGLL